MDDYDEYCDEYDGGDDTELYCDPADIYSPIIEE